MAGPAWSNVSIMGVGSHQRRVITPSLNCIVWNVPPFSGKYLQLNPFSWYLYMYPECYGIYLGFNETHNNDYLSLWALQVDMNMFWLNVLACICSGKILKSKMKINVKACTNLLSTVGGSMGVWSWEWSRGKSYSDESFCVAVICWKCEWNVKVKSKHEN